MGFTELEQELISIGLSEKESAIYIALLELGTAVVSDVSKKSKINRSTSYVLLESLSKKGLVSISRQASMRWYTPAPPERLVQLIDEQVKHDTQLLNQARALLPELKSVFNGVGPKPKVSFFEGVEGMRRVYDDTLTSNETILTNASIDNVRAVWPEYFSNYFHRHAHGDINTHPIHPNPSAARERLNTEPEAARESESIPADNHNCSPKIYIYDNKITFISFRDKFGLIIEHAELANAMKKVFELSWAETKRHDPRQKLTGPARTSPPPPTPSLALITTNHDAETAAKIVLVNSGRSMV